MEKILNINGCGFDCPNFRSCPTHSGQLFECLLINEKVLIPYMDGASSEMEVLKNWFENLCTLTNAEKE